MAKVWDAKNTWRKSFSYFCVFESNLICIEKKIMDLEVLLLGGASNIFVLPYAFAG